ncbi:MAG TPA: tetratricopeptide repeat protein [Patescibacteria group bacterium]|nr:tetratricopeptide repeat protein [Patescibacteria group bacterium]
MGRAAGVKHVLPLSIAGAALLAAFCYFATLHNEFVFDDIDVIARNPLVTGERLDAARIFSSHYWQHLTPAGNLYRPLVILTYALNHLAGGLDPSGYHLVNLVLHALCSGLVVALSARLGLPARGALAAGLLFAAHPIHTEAVTGVVGRAELVAAACVLGGWLVHLGRSQPRPWRPVAIGLLFAAGLLSKENAIVLPALMFLGDVWRNRRDRIGWRQAAPAYVACAVVTIAWIILRAMILSPIPAGSPYEGPFAQVPATQRILTALPVMGRYLLLLAAPLHLSADYSYDQIPMVSSLSDPSAIFAAGLLVLLLAAGLRRFALERPGHLDGLCALVFFVTMAPVSNLFVPIGTMMAERLLYLPSVAFCIALPALWEAVTDPAARTTRHSPATRVTGLLLVIVLLGLYATRTITRNRDWKDQLTLFSVTTLTSPRSAKAHYNFGVALEDSGQSDRALDQYLVAVAIKPLDPRSHHNAGLLLAKMGRPAEASLHLDQASRLDPALPKVFSSLGAVWSHLGRSSEAKAAFRRGLEQDPDDQVALYNLGTLALMDGHPDEAVAPLERARDLAPSDPDAHYQLGLALLGSNRPGDAIAEWREALRLSTDLPEAHLQLARALALTGSWEDAALEARKARAAGMTLPPDLVAALTRHGTPP